MPSLKQEQFLPIPLQEAWNFFATPNNLNKITPEDVVFTITSEVPDKMYQGLIISYKIQPVLYIRLNWVTEITKIEENRYFVDEQIKGPYKIWRHEHHFKEVEGGVLMTDLLYYEIGKSVFGWLAGKLFVHQKVKSIFSHRYKILERLFSKQKA